MKKIFLAAAIVFAMAANAQVSKVSLQASGLTCSMCSNSINKALKSLDFVDKVDANIKTSTFDITFKPNSKVDFDKLKNKVEGAGFSVAAFTATMQFNNLKVNSTEAVSVGDKKLQFINIKDQTLNGSKTVRVIDKGFISSKDYKKNSIASADPKDGRVYHVTI
jgi:copper chaperone CopZ